MRKFHADVCFSDLLWQCCFAGANMVCGSGYVWYSPFFAMWSCFLEQAFLGGRYDLPFFAMQLPKNDKVTMSKGSPMSTKKVCCLAAFYFPPSPLCCFPSLSRFPALPFYSSALWSFSSLSSFPTLFPPTFTVSLTISFHYLMSSPSFFFFVHVQLPLHTLNFWELNCLDIFASAATATNGTRAFQVWYRVKEGMCVCIHVKILSH